MAYSQKIDKKKSLNLNIKVKSNQIIINSQIFHNTNQILIIILYKYHTYVLDVMYLIRKK